MDRALLGDHKHGQLQIPDVIFPDFSPYIQGFHSLVEELMAVLFTMPHYCTSKSEVTHQAFMSIFRTALSQLSLEEPEPSVPNICKPVATKHVLDVFDKDSDLISWSEPIIMIPAKVRQICI